MITGRYFRLDVDTSVVGDGISVFEYHDLPIYFEEFNGMSPRYPISVVISAEEVKFLIHYFTFATSEEDNFADCPTKLVNGADCVIRHTEECIMLFNYSRNSDDALASPLKEIFDTVFPQGKIFSHYLDLRYYEKVDKDSRQLDSCREIIYDALINNDKKECNLSYSSSRIWALKDDMGRFCLKDEVEGKYRKFLRKLLLDFMFDMMHTDVFQNSIYFDKMKTSLMSDVFFSAIVKKADYYYYRELVSQKAKSSSLTSNDGMKICMTYYEDVEKEWMNVIMSPVATEHFKHIHCSNVFSQIKEEAVQTYKFGSKESWFVDPEEEMRRVMFPLKESEKIGFCTSELWYDSFREGMKKENEKERKNRKYRQEKRRLKVSKWFLKRYDFSDTFRIHFFPHFNSTLILCLLLFFALLFYPPQPGAGLFGIPTAILLALGVVAALALWGIVLLFKSRDVKEDSEVEKLAIKRIEWKNFKRASLLCAIFILFDVFFLAVDWSMNVRWAALGVGMILLFGVFMKNSMHLILPRLFAAIATAWFTIALSEDLFKAFFDKPVSVITIVLLAFVVAAFLYSEIGKLLPYSTFIRKTARVLELMIIGYAISLLIGFMMINFTGDYFLERSGYLEQYRDENPHMFGVPEDYELTHPQMLDKLVENDEFTTMTRYAFQTNGYKFFVLRNFLIQFALVAMFIGVFLQMSFEEKNITES